MTEQSIKSSLATLQVMKESEETVAEFYLLCSEIYTEHYEFWASLAREELAHARVIESLIDLVRVHSEEFKPGKWTPVNIVKSFIKKNQSNIEILREHELPEDKALLMAYQIENTFLEQRYAEVVDTDNQQYRAMLSQVISDTLKHKNKVTAMLMKIRKESGQIKGSS